MQVVVEAWTPSRHDEETGELSFRVGDRSLVAETRVYHEDSRAALRRGTVVDLVLQLDRWFDERGLPRRPDRPPALALDPVEGARYRVTGRLHQVEDRAGPGPTWFVLHVEVGLAEPLPVAGFLARETEHLVVGDQVTVEGVLLCDLTP